MKFSVRGDVCFWTGANFTGQKCSWDAADPDWQGGSIRCSWAATTNVKSVWNAGTYKVRSHKWISGSCG
ncbi:peptidase inhibitor family I36 protein [Streptomyces sp. B21-083]|uniref:peptidase inhibitor family I36 protein n=1 Tax=Streptomyces sp. B21-083 TaxID=3039410 RepID=UPI002FEF61AC